MNAFCAVGVIEELRSELAGKTIFQRVTLNLLAVARKHEIRASEKVNHACGANRMTQNLKNALRASGFVVLTMVKE